MSLVSTHSSYQLQNQYIVSVENNYQPIEGNGGKENEKGERKKKQLEVLDNLSSELQSSIYILYVSANEVYTREIRDQKGMIKTININRLFEV